MALEDIHEVFDDNDQLPDEPAAVPPAPEKAEAAKPVEPEKPETKEEPVKDEPKPEAKTVPLAALHESREIIKELRAEIEESNKKLARYDKLDERLSAWEKAQQQTTQKNEQEDFEREFEEDPISALRKKNEQLQARIDAQEQAKQQQTEEEKTLQSQQQEFATMIQTGADMVRQYAQDHKDYPQAFNYLIERRTEEMKAIGITDQKQITEELNKESIALMANAMKRGVNPGETVYNLAKARGYIPTQLDKDVEDPVTTDKLDDELDRLEKGVNASQSLSGGGGGKPAGTTLTVDQIDAMSEEDFDKFWASMSKGRSY